ncbi:MAG: 6,7-dimethyl-8-ribityllumazine synthase [Planctomycetes bacterium]|jgi:6,7-dimethyl-8-ribityllumazine synthase|nr:6,7-dimethyl-8-ribityllumazine synthase [Planctomycetota bacterium]MCL4730743.1 6,7-dimethyl-8-ribityllumazine synthase [Planctomycetota bacterium]
MAKKSSRAGQPRVIEGMLNAAGMRFAIVAARFNEFIVEKLVQGALDSIRRHGGDADGTTLAWVPGAFEIPVVARKLCESRQYDAVICLGAVIRGNTPHFDYVAGEAAKGIGQAGLTTGVPCIFGVLTTETLEQAIERAGTKLGNKGFDAATTAIETVDVLRRV